MQITPQIWLTIGLIVYYMIFQIIDDVKRISGRTYTNSRKIESLRSEFKVTIRTFRAKYPYAFSSFRAIWINEKLLKASDSLIFAFHHEYYHLKRNHKAWALFLRFLIALSPLSKYFVDWWLVVIIVLTVAYLTDKLTNQRKGLFEKKANEYASKITSNDSNK